MTKANGSLKPVVVAALASILLAACGGGAQTTDNPLPTGGSGGSGTAYNGPAPRDNDVFKFQQELWSNVKTMDRCGNCHSVDGGQTPMFARNDDVNMAYDDAVLKVNTDQPALSELVTKVGSGHNCWVADANVCASVMTTWIEKWLGNGAGDGGRTINLTPPDARDPGTSLSFPNDGGAAYAATVYPVVTQYCAGCHSSESPNAQQPYFADPDIVSAYDAAKPRINLDVPEFSRLVVRLRSEFHNCWSDCASNAQTMEDAIAAFAGMLTPTTVDPNLVTSKAVTLLGDGIVASGGNRYEDAQIALWEFKTGSGSIAYDTSGVDPAINLNLTPEVTWYGGWGITTNGGKAQGSTTASAKLHSEITAATSGEFSIEAWVIPANVTQEMAKIVSYTNGPDSRNFALQQNLYDYDFLLRGENTSLSGLEDALSTPSADEVLQATLQHVVATYDPINGRSIYVNGELVSNTDPVDVGILTPWQETFAVVLGNEASGDAPFEGTIRLAAIHDRALTQEQITQNYDVGVGEKFYLMFDISEEVKDITVTDQSSYILFEVQQYDSYAYLFDKPHFITLDGSAPEGIEIEGLRIALNGAEAPVGQSYSTLDDQLSASEFGELGQPLSPLGAVLPLEKGPEFDEFFLTFDRLNLYSFDRPEDPMLVITPTNLDPSSHIGVRTFDEINATYSAITGVIPTPGSSVDMTYQELRQSLPAVENVDTFLSSHQVAIAQLAIEYCNALVEDTSLRAAKFPGFDFNNTNSATTFSVANRGAFVDPMIAMAVGNKRTGAQLASQPSFDTVNTELATATAVPLDRPDNLVQRLVNGGSPTTAVAKGVCAATIGSAATLVQ
jgi:mono/diheme cytochrome c family protein